jgi:hypothetical protein
MEILPLKINTRQNSKLQESIYVFIAVQILRNYFSLCCLKYPECTEATSASCHLTIFLCNEPFLRKWVRFERRENVGASASYNPMGLQGPLQGRTSLGYVVRTYQNTRPHHSPVQACHLVLARETLPLDRDQRFEWRHKTRDEQLARSRTCRYAAVIDVGAETEMLPSVRHIVSTADTWKARVTGVPVLLINVY